MIKAYIIGQINANKDQTALSKMMNIDGVESVDMVYGKYDFIAHLNVKDEEHLGSVVLEEFRKIPTLLKTQTLITQKAIR